MKAFTVERGVLAPLFRSNIDTDAILPKQYLKLISKTGFGQYLFDDWRYLPDRVPDPAFILNEARYQGAKFLLAGANFGCGSSREHAVWALDEYGFRAKALPAATQAAETAETVSIEVNLDTQTIQCGAASYPFTIDSFRKHSLYHGLDDIGQTLQHADAIRAFEARHRQQLPWLFKEQT